MRTAFFGTPAIAVPFLDKLVRHSKVELVVTNPDQPAGRGYELKASAVKEAAFRHQIPLQQPEKARDPAFLESFSTLKPDVGIVVAYGKLLPLALLEMPKFGFLNVHFSLLPAYRGAAPIQWTLINGEKQTGVSLFWLDEGMDTGPLFIQKQVPIEPTDDADTLRTKLVQLGVTALEEGLIRLEKEGRTEQPQAGNSSRAPMLTKEDGRLRWADSAQQNLNRLKGVTPWPGAFTVVKHGDREARLKILKVQVVGGSAGGEIGSVCRVEPGKGFLVKCGQDLLEIVTVQPEGKKPMPAWDFWQGARMKVGDKFL